MLILECSQGCYAVEIWTSDLDLWPWKSIGFQTLLKIMYVPSLVKIHGRMLILECSQGCYTVKLWPGDIDLWPTTLKINSVPDSKGLSMYRVWSKSIEGCWFLSVHKDVTRSKNYPVTLTFNPWHWKSIGSQTLLRTKYVPSLVKIHWRMLILECSQGCYAVKIWPGELDLENQ